MAKAIRLLDEIATIPIAPVRGDSWASSLKETDPETHAEIFDVMTDFVKGGRAFQVFKTTTGLKQFIGDAFKKRGKPDPLASVSEQSFRREVLAMRKRSNVS